MRYELADFEWAAIKPMLPNKPRGVPRRDDRRERPAQTPGSSMRPPRPPLQLVRERIYCGKPAA